MAVNREDIKTAEKATKEEIATEQGKISLGFEGETDSALCCFLKSSSIIKKKKKTSLGFTDAEDFPLYSMKCKSSVEKKESEYFEEIVYFKRGRFSHLG